MSEREGFRRPWGAMPVAELIDRLQRISEYHQPDPGDFYQCCVACDHPWPCLTFKIAADNYLLEDGSE